MNLQSNIIYEIYVSTSLSNEIQNTFIPIIVGIESKYFIPNYKCKICRLCSGGKYAIFSFENKLEKLSEFYEKIIK